MTKQSDLSISPPIGTTGGILALAFIVDMIVWYKAGSINFVDEQEKEAGTAEEMANLKTQESQAAQNDCHCVKQHNNT